MSCERLSSISSDFTYFYLKSDELTAELLKSVGEGIGEIRRYGEEWQLQVRTNTIEWED